jgi:hypothetical protein
MLRDPLATARKSTGPFACLAVDPQHESAILVTDHFGLMPLFRAFRAGIVGYSNSLGVLAQVLQLPIDLHPSSVREMLVLQMVLGNRTLLREAHYVSPAVVVTLATGEPLVQQYWGWNHLTPSLTPSRDIVQETYDIIEQAVLASLPDRVSKVALPLSGGLDSRLLCAILAKNGVPLQAYNIQFGKENPIAQRVADTLDVPLDCCPMWSRPESIPDAHRAMQCSYHVHQVWGWDMARRAASEGQCDVLFDGLALDAVLGFTHHVAGPGVAELTASLVRNYVDICQKSLARLLGETTARTWFDDVRAELSMEAAKALDESGSLCSDYFLMHNRLRKYTFGYCLANRKCISSRFPYVANRLFEHCMQLPTELRAEHRLYRRLYQEQFPKLAVIPWAKTGLPLDRYRSVSTPSWRLYLNAAVRRLSWGSWSWDEAGAFDVALRRSQPLRAVFDAVLGLDVSAVNRIVPSPLCRSARRAQLRGYDLGGLLQGLYTVKHFTAVLKEGRWL